jgi:hypothetical protein
MGIRDQQQQQHYFYYYDYYEVGPFWEDEIRSLGGEGAICRLWISIGLISIRLISIRLISGWNIKS